MTKFFAEVKPLASKPENTIKLRELDKRSTYANSKQGKCTMSNCTNKVTHWLTRQNADYCQSDMICHQHAVIWMQVKNLVSSTLLSL